ncbi:gene transfer agent family protein [Paracoccus sp. (in: a-proteobacteria)]|uniref:gene transfer agent family protein n=1 Tax=Paracoccus sp. TaxID=267 RepID=UPI0028A02FD2|nr:gene transfer agent family protein [Paracoccus sp. (in: a-proteobacteria)]
MRPSVVAWPGGEHSFRLGLVELESIQQETDCGPEWLLHKLNVGQWLASELVAVIRWGLIGGGMAPVDALKAVKKAFDFHDLISFKVPVQTILGAALFGPPYDAVGEPIPVEPTPEQEQTASGSSAPITD